jgi:hypothetical protein
MSARRPALRLRLTRRRLALAAIVFLGLGYGTLIQSFSWNQTSHYGLIRAIDHGKTTIDPYAAETGDKARYKNHWYSARAPGLALYAEPWYKLLLAADAPAWAQRSPAQRNADEMIWTIGLWGNVLPGLLIALLIWLAVERIEPGFGAAAALAVGLGTLLLPLSTLLFSHVFTACLAFAAFVLLMRERDGPQRLRQLALAGVLVGYAIASEYPLLFVAAVLGVYALTRGDARAVWPAVRRAAAYGIGALVGVIPLLIYDKLAFGSFTHVAYADIPRQKAGFFGIGTPSLKTLATLLFDSRGLLTLAPVLVMSGVGLVLLARRGRRAETRAIVAIVCLYLFYNSGYYLPFGGGIMGPRFLTTILPFLALPLALSFRRFPGPTIALAGVSMATMTIATATHPLVGYETETSTWMHYLSSGSFQPTIASAYGAGRGWVALLPFIAAMAAAIVLGAFATERMRLTPRALAAGVLAAATWALLAAIMPTALSLDSVALHKIVAAGDRTALHKPWGSYPLTSLVLVAFGAGVLTLLVARLLRHGRRPALPRDRGGQVSERRTETIAATVRA